MQTLAILISGNGSNLQAIIDTLGADRISIVISDNAYAYGLIRARNHDIATTTIDHRLYGERPDDYEMVLHNRLQSFNPDLIVLAGFMRILSAKFVSKYKNKILNIHPSLLPKYKGLNTHQRALDNNDKEHGVSIHIVTAELDAGPVLMQERFIIEEGDTVEDLQQKCHTLEHQMYPEAIQLFDE